MKRVESSMGRLKLSLSISLLSLLIWTFVDQRLIISGEDRELYHGTVFREVITVEYSNIFKKFLTPDFNVDVDGDQESLSVESDKHTIIIKGYSVKDQIKINIHNSNKTYVRTLYFSENMEDSDNDSFYDVVELESQEDRESFVNWFTSIAKSQFYNMSDNWDLIHRDCAGLITYSYKEALKKHDFEWLRNYSDLEEQRDVEKYNYPNIPIIGDNCFYSAEGFIPSANASGLMNYNMTFISKDVKYLEKGDVLFFYDESYEMPYHSMIYLGEPGYVVYHTGPIDDTNSGEVRMLLLNDLFKHPDEKWHPDINNKKYIGGFRWRILM